MCIFWDPCLAFDPPENPLLNADGSWWTHFSVYCYSRSASPYLWGFLGDGDRVPLPCGCDAYSIGRQFPGNFTCSVFEVENFILEQNRYVEDPKIGGSHSSRANKGNRETDIFLIKINSYYLLFLPLIWNYLNFRKKRLISYTIGGLIMFLSFGKASASCTVHNLVKEGEWKGLR